jgi:hypothetical protein
MDTPTRIPARTLEKRKPPLDVLLRSHVPDSVKHSFTDVFKKGDAFTHQSESLVLTPSQPRSGDSYLTIHAAMTVQSDPDQPYALFSSDFPDAVFPTVQVEFAPVVPSKPHLVEFHVELFQDKPYKFRKFWFPFEWEDMQDNNATVITVLVPHVPDWSYTYWAMLQQRNEVGDQAGWMLKKVRVIAID